MPLYLWDINRTECSMPLVLYYTCCKLFVILILKYCFINTISFASLLGNMLCVNKGLQSPMTWQRRNAINERFMSQHNNDSTTAWMFQASGIIPHKLEIVCYFNLKILFINKITFAQYGISFLGLNVHP